MKFTAHCKVHKTVLYLRQPHSAQLHTRTVQNGQSLVLAYELDKSCFYCPRADSKPCGSSWTVTQIVEKVDEPKSYWCTMHNCAVLSDGKVHMCAVAGKSKRPEARYQRNNVGILITGKWICQNDWELRS